MAPQFGDLVTVPSADAAHPTRRGVFVRAAASSAVINGGVYWEVTDMRGDFWEVRGRDLARAEVRPLDVPAMVNDALAREPG